MIALLKKTLFIFLIISANSLLAQDTIIKNNNQKIPCKIIEIGTTEIKYKFSNLPDGPLIIIDKNEVYKVKLQGSTEVLINENRAQPRRRRHEEEQTDDHYKKEEFVPERTQAIKFELLHPLIGSLAFAYERVLTNELSGEVKIGIIGAGISTPDNTTNLNNNVSGLFFKAAPKLLLYRLAEGHKKYQYKPLFGPYLKAELIYSNFTRNNLYYTNYSYNPYVSSSGSYSATTNAYGVGIIFGVETLIANLITFEFYVGGGYAWATTSNPPASTGLSSNSNYNTPNFMYSHIYLGDGIPAMISGGLAIGYAF